MRRVPRQPNCNLALIVEYGENKILNIEGIERIRACTLDIINSLFDDAVKNHSQPNDMLATRKHSHEPTKWFARQPNDCQPPGRANTSLSTTRPQAA